MFWLRLVPPAEMHHGLVDTLTDGDEAIAHRPPFSGREPRLRRVQFLKAAKDAVLLLPNL